jgi:hypothetical protein
VIAMRNKFDAFGELTWGGWVMLAVFTVALAAMAVWAFRQSTDGGRTIPIEAAVLMFAGVAVLVVLGLVASVWI